MFGPLGFPEMLFILVLALLIFGPKRLPEVGRTIGKGMAQFRKATTDLKRTIENEIALEEEPARRPMRPAPRPETKTLLPASSTVPEPGRAPDAAPGPAAIEPVEVLPAAPSAAGESRPD